MKKQIVVMMLLCIQTLLHAQNIGIGNTTPNASAKLDITASNAGLLIPRVALTDINDAVTIASPANSLLVYNTATAGSGRFIVTPGFYYWNSLSLAWIPIVPGDNSTKGAWLLGGNIATSLITNFLGTTDNQSLLFKINNTNAGYLGTAGNTFWGLNSGNINSSGNNNTAMGSGSLFNNITGYSNVAIGISALQLNNGKSNLVAIGDSALLNNGTGAGTSLQAVYNTAVGSKALYTNNIGSYNTAIGYNALLTNSSGTQNTATGVDALHFNSTGILNAAHGINALFLNTMGSFNSAHGANSLVNNSTGSNNTASGFGALFSNTTGYSNIGIGINALRLNTDRSNIVAIGDSALFNNGVGATIFFHGLYNTAVGTKALYANNLGRANTAIGSDVLQNNTIGYGNVGIGSNALNKNTTGGTNVAMGLNAMLFSLVGSNNIALGYDALSHNSNGNDNIAIGTSAAGLQSTRNNIIAIGDSALYINGLGAAPYQASFNIAIGSKGLYSNTTGYSNTVLGYQAMEFNTTGSANTGMGVRSLYNNASGDGNAALDHYALLNNSSGSHNVAHGYFALQSNYTGSDNVGIGAGALTFNYAGNNAVAVGDSAMFNFSGAGFHGNTALGSKALFSLNTADGNTAIGYQTLYNTTFGRNTGVGYRALYNSTGGNLNSALGYTSLYNNSSGYNNVAIGPQSLITNTTGHDNTGIGSNADVYTNNLFNATAVGASAQANCNNCVILGSIAGNNAAGSDVNVGIGTSTPQTKLHVSPNAAGGILIGGNKNAGGFTDLEMGISANTGGYGYIQSTQSSGSAYGNISLNPFGGNIGIHMNIPLSPFHIKQTNDSYPVVGGGLRLERNANSNHWEVGTDTGDDLDFAYNNIAKGYIDNGTGHYTEVSDIRMKKDILPITKVLPSILLLQPKTYHYKDNAANAPLCYGFIAQEMEEIFPAFVKTKGPDNMKAIAYQNFSVIAIKAIQEQQAIIETQNNRIEKLEQQMELLLKK